MKIKFTDSFIKALKATGEPYSHGDTEHRGLMVRVSATGTKTFALAYHSKADQKTRFLTFGQYPRGDARRCLPPSCRGPRRACQRRGPAGQDRQRRGR